MNKTFSATLLKDKDKEKGGWTYIIWSDSAAFFGTKKPVKVKGTIDGVEFQTTFLPVGDGTHLLPVKAAILAAVKKQQGDEVVVCLTERL